MLRSWTKRIEAMLARVLAAWRPYAASRARSRVAARSLGASHRR
jgi:hypothetical protein